MVSHHAADVVALGVDSGFVVCSQKAGRLRMILKPCRAVANNFCFLLINIFEKCQPFPGKNAGQSHEENVIVWHEDIFPLGLQAFCLGGVTKSPQGLAQSQAKYRMF